MSEWELSRWARFCWWLASKLAPKDGSRYGPRIFGRSVRHSHTAWLRVTKSSQAKPAQGGDENPHG